MTGTTKQPQRITPRAQTPEFLRIDRGAEIKELRERVRALELEARQVGMAAEAEKVARRKALNATLLPQLLQLLRERGLEDLIAEATARAAAATAEVVQ